MSPSATVRPGQIKKLYDVLEAAFLKSGLPANETQVVIEADGSEIAASVVADVRKRVEARLDMIARKVKVSRSRSPQQTLDATGRSQYTDKKVLQGMPWSGDEEVEMCFFKLGRFISNADLDKEYELRGLEPDPYGQAQVNIDDPSFADQHPNGSHWKDKDGNWCFLAFGRWFDGRSVDCRRSGNGWHGRWWFAGRRKSSSR